MPLNEFDKQKQATKDLLQAELSNTLKRRKPVQIIEPPKYQYPDENEHNGSSNDKNNNSSANESSSSFNTNGAPVETQNIKPININNVLSVVSKVKLPDLQYVPSAANSQTLKTEPKPRGDDHPKLEISHGKPNYTINRKNSESKPLERQISGSSTLRSPVTKDKPMLSKVNSQPLVTKFNTLPKKSSVSELKVKLPSPATSQAIPMNDSAIKSASIVKNVPIFSKKSAPVTQAYENYVDVKISSINPNKEHTSPSTQNVSSKKALFEQKSPDAVSQKPKMSFDVSKPVSPSKPISFTKPTPWSPSHHQNGNVTTKTTIMLNGANQPPQIVQKTSTINGKRNNFANTVHHSKDIMTTNNNNSRKNFNDTGTNYEQKTIVSFSKDLTDAPNNFPEQIRVTRTMKTESSTIVHSFKNIRFSIDPNTNVVPKPK